MCYKNEHKLLQYGIFRANCYAFNKQKDLFRSFNSIWLSTSVQYPDKNFADSICYNSTMLSVEQENYLKTIPTTRLTHIQPYNPVIDRISGDLISKIGSKIPLSDIAYIGASALKISGQNDIDINVLSVKENFNNYKEILIELFGAPTLSGSSIEWQMEIEGFEATAYLTDKHSKGINDQINIFNILNNNPSLLSEYEKIKSKYNNLPYRDYQKAKYEFYNKIS